MPKKSQAPFDDAIDLSSLASKPISVSVDGKELPLKIGDKIIIEDKDKVVRTVVKIQVSEDGHILYCLEWFNGTEFKMDWLTAAELFYVWSNSSTKKSVGFSA